MDDRVISSWYIAVSSRAEKYISLHYYTSNRASIVLEDNGMVEFDQSHEQPKVESTLLLLLQLSGFPRLRIIYQDDYQGSGTAVV